MAFNQNVIPTTSGVTFVDTSLFPIQNESVKKLLKNLSIKYGYPIIRKTIPRLVWGDTLVTNKRTGAISSVPDMSQNFRFDFPIPVPLDSVLYLFRKLPIVKYAEEPVAIAPLLTPNDPYFSSQWNLSRINASPAWDITTGSSNIRVAIIDVSFADLPFNISNHEDFQLPGGGNKFVGGSLNNSSYHARMVAGVIGATTNNNTGIASLGWNTSLLAYHFVEGTAGTNLADLIDQAIAPVGQGGGDADILNFSITTLGMCDGKMCPRAFYVISEAVGRAYASGVIMIAAAGNGEYQGCDPIDCSGGLPYQSFPAAYDQWVIAVTATNPSDNFQENWNYGSWVDVAAPGVGDATQYDILSTYAGYSQYVDEAGTSFSAPHVSALAALILALNPSLTPSLVKTIIEQSADKVGQYPYVNGRNNYLGYGRINAYQALLLAHAYSNKSINYWASGYNNNHTIERGYFGKLHEVFHSGGEIFYRRSSNNGTSWEITTRLSSGNGTNEAPSIVAGVGSTDILCVTWQRKLSNYSYEIYTRFSSDMGTTWLATSSPMSVTVSWNQSNGNYGPGPTPVVASYYRSGSEGTPSYLLVYSASNGLYFRTSNTYNSGWTASNVIPGSSGSNSSIWFPSLASYNNQGYRINLIYDDRFYHVYSQVFNDNGTWSNRVIADWIGSYNRTSSIAIDNNNTMLGVWSGWNSTYSKYSIRFREGNAVNNTWSTYWKEWCISTNSSYFPSLSYYNKGGEYPNGRVVSYHTDNNNIFRQKYSGSYSGDWTQESVTNNALFPNITHERSNTLTPKEIWTNQTSPYTIQFSSVSLPKCNALDSIRFHRAAVISDKTNNANLRIELSQLYIEYDNGEKIFIPFKDYDYGAQYNLTIANLFDHLQTEKINIPSNAAKLKFTLLISSSQPDTLSDGTINTNNTTKFRGINFELLVKDGLNNSLLSNLSLQSLYNDNGIHNFSKSYEFNATTIRNKNIFIIPSVNINGPFRNEDLVFFLGNITISNETQLFKDSVLTAQDIKIPKDYCLGQNFPNPFNPRTIINFSLPKESNVSLKIYDVLGKLVHTFFNSERKSAGNYEISFDANELPSGVYFYTLISGDFTQTCKMILAK